MSAPGLPERLRAADLDRYLATLYAPPARRDALFALHALDLELMEVVRTTSQPMIGLIRLAWWREALERLDTAGAPAQPLLQALAAHVLPLGVTGAELAALEDGFVALVEEPFDRERYLEGRGAVLFALAARILGGARPARGAGRTWAAAELLRMRPDEDALPVERGEAPPVLAALADLAARDLRRGPGRRGAPSRQLRMLWRILRGGRGGER